MQSGTTLSYNAITKCNGNDLYDTVPNILTLFKYTTSVVHEKQPRCCQFKWPCINAATPPIHNHKVCKSDIFH